MVLAELSPAATTSLILGCFVGVGFAISKLSRWYLAAANRAQGQVFAGTSASPEAHRGSVQVVFHTYASFLVIVRQTEHRFWAVPSEARLILSRLNRHNFAWGLWGPGGVYVPILSLGNYWAQLKRIKAQEKEMAVVLGQD